jgi:hypothetical protein
MSFCLCYDFSGAPKLKGLGNLCALCPKGSDCAWSSSKNTYSGYHGAFNCMADKQGDVAFVKHVTTGEVLEYTSKYGTISDYKYICPDGTIKGNKVFTDLISNVLCTVNVICIACPCMSIETETPISVIIIQRKKSFVFGCKAKKTSPAAHVNLPARKTQRRVLSLKT